MISCTVQPLLVLGTLVFLRSSYFFFSQKFFVLYDCTASRYIAHGRIINFFISEDNCDDDDESYSIRAGWWLVGLGLGLGMGLGSGCGTVGLGLGFGSGSGTVGLGLGLGLALDFGAGCGTVGWGGVCRGGIRLAGQLIGHLSGKLNAYRSQCKVRGGSDLYERSECASALLTSPPWPFIGSCTRLIANERYLHWLRTQLTVRH